MLHTPLQDVVVCSRVDPAENCRTFAAAETLMLTNKARNGVDIAVSGTVKIHPGFNDQKLILIDPCITRGERAVRGEPKRLFVWETWPNVVPAHRAGAAVDPNVPELYTTSTLNNDLA